MTNKGIQAKPLAISLLSGGMDSCVAAAIARETCELALLHVNYDQRTQQREQRAFEEIADYFHVPPSRRLIVSVDYLRNIGGSSLTDENIEVSKADLNRSGIPSSYVPFRNTHFLAIAVSWAEVIGATSIFMGAVEEDSSGYPDCRKIYLEAFNKLVEAGTKPETRIEIVAPLIEMNKSEIVRRGVALEAPLDLTWSCYKDEDIACGQCDSCALRLRAFQQAGVDDPLPYKFKDNYS